MINFNDLPGDIKSMIYKVNKEAERDEAYSNKKKYNEVLTELNEVLIEFIALRPKMYSLKCVSGLSLLFHK